jgi:hypothetical protein
MSEVKINKKLNLVCHLEETAMGDIYVHSTPIMRETFEQYYAPIARAFTRIFATPIAHASGPRVAKLVIRDEAMAIGTWEGKSGVKEGLFEELRRLTHVVTSVNGKWQHVPLEEATGLDDDDRATIENYVCFFTVASAIQGKQELREMMSIVSTIWPFRSEPLSVTDYVAGLQTSKTAGDTGKKETA